MTENKTVKILHLYHDLMNLYGDWGNPVVLARELTARGCRAIVEQRSVGDEIDFEAYDFAYIGSGTESSQCAMMKDLARHKEAFLNRINEGMHILLTGNSHEVLGQAITRADGARFETLGLLEFETTQHNSRVTGDCVCKATFLPEKLIGFINRAGGTQSGEVERPFQHESGPYAKSSPPTEGIKHKNILGTYLTGPILLRNPPLLDYFADRLTSHHKPKHSSEDVFFKHQAKAYQMAVTELSERK